MGRIALGAWTLTFLGALGTISAMGAETGVYNVLDFGAKADGVVDDTTAVQDALRKAGEKGGVVFLPAGVYLIGGSLRIPIGVTLKGSWEMAHHGAWDKGTTLLATRGRGTEEGPALIEMQASTAVIGLSVYYPEQDPEAIVPYPWTIRGRGMHNTIENVTLINSYNGITIGPEWNELHLIRNVFGCPLRRGILIDNTTDIGRLENVHFNIHYWHRAHHPNGPRSEGPEASYRQWVQEHLQAFIFGRTDWESVKDTFSYGAHTTYTFTDMGHGAMNGSLVGIGADGCIYGMVVEKIQPMGLVVTNGQFAAFRHPQMPKHDDDPAISAIYTKETFDGNLSFVNCTSWGGNAFAHLEGAGTVRFTDCHVRDWNVYDKGRTAVSSFGPRLILSGNEFATGGLNVFMAEKSPGGILTGNLFSGPVMVPADREAEFILRDNLTRQDR